jgi:hypothetical protein
MLDRAEALAALGASDARLRGALQYLVRESDDEAIGHIVARLRADPWGPARHLLDLALLANGTRQAMEALLFASSTLQRRDPVLRGLVLADGAPGLAFEDNPWGIPAGASLDNALAVIWAPVASLSRAERAVHALQREVLALALVELDQPRRWAVGYLHPWRRMAYEIEAEDLPSPPECFARREALDWADYADLGLFFGFGPSTSGSTLSRAVGEFWRVHDGMEDGLLWLNGHDRLWPLAQIFDALKTPAGLEYFRLNNGNRRACPPPRYAPISSGRARSSGGRARHRLLVTL